MRRLIVVVVGTLATSASACKFPPPADVPDDAAAAGYSLGGSVRGLWSGGAITIHLDARATTEDLAVDATSRFAFQHRLRDGDTYTVSVKDDGPDHDCVIPNGSGTIAGADQAGISVTCTNLIAHSLAITTPGTFAFDPSVVSYTLPVSVLQQQVSVLVTGPGLTSVTVAGQPAVVGELSTPVVLDQPQVTVPVVVTKAPWSQRYELVFEPGGAVVEEALHALASNGGAGDRFGYSVSINDSFAAVGAPFEDSSTSLGNDDAITDSGMLYVFRRAGLAWMDGQRLKGTSPTASRVLGSSIAIEGDLLVGGAPGAGAGAVYVFRLDRTSGLWREEQRITAPSGRAGDSFGSYVAIDDGRIAIGAPGNDGVNPDPSANYGAIYVFEHVGTSWTEQSRVMSPTAGDFLGNLFSFDGNTIALLVNFEPRVYRLTGTTWFRDALPNVIARSIDVSGDIVAIGQAGDASGNGLPGDMSAPDSGAVRVFTRIGTVWSQTGFLKATSPQIGAEIGSAVRIERNVIATTSPTMGTLQTFHRVGATWRADPPITPSGPPAEQTLGYGLDLDGSGVLAGSSAEDAVWFFR